MAQNQNDNRLAALSVAGLTALSPDALLVYCRTCLESARGQVEALPESDVEFAVKLLDEAAAALESASVALSDESKPSTAQAVARMLKRPARAEASDLTNFFTAALRGLGLVGDMLATAESSEATTAKAIWKRALSR